jgi:hypothetical protein
MTNIKQLSAKRVSKENREKTKAKKEKELAEKQSEKQ